jgi:hypothetical protein
VGVNIDDSLPKFEKEAWRPLPLAGSIPPREEARCLTDGSSEYMITKDMDIEAKCIKT